MRDHISHVVNCDLCGKTTEDALVAASGSQCFLGESVALSTVVCSECRFVFQGEQFSDELLGALYESDTSFAFDESAGIRTLVEAHLMERQRVISEAMIANGFCRYATVLDIGGGIGECCKHLVDDHTVLLVDASDRDPVDSRIRKVSGLFSEQVEDASCDVIVLNHVLEHAFSPSQMLSSAYRVARLGGIVVVEVPFELYTPLIARHLGDWRHVAYFSRTTLAKFLAKSGFSVQRIALEDGCYGSRRLPVIRAVAKKGPEIFPVTYKSPVFSLVKDMLAPVSIVGLLKRVMDRS